MKVNEKVYIYNFDMQLDPRKRPYIMYIPSFEDCIIEKEVEVIEHTKDGKMINLKYDASKASIHLEKLQDKARKWYKKDIRFLKTEFKKGLKGRIADLEEQTVEWKAIVKMLTDL